MWHQIRLAVRRRQGRGTINEWQGERSGVAYPLGGALPIIGCRCGSCPEHGSRLAEAILAQDRPPS